jgi:hypothetical protein
LRGELDVVIRIHPSVLLGTFKLHLSFLLLSLHLCKPSPSILLPLVFLLLNSVIHPYVPPLLLVRNPRHDLCLLLLGLLQHPLSVPRLDRSVVPLEPRRILKLLRPILFVVEEIVVVGLALVPHLLAVRDLHADHFLTVIVQLRLQMNVVLLLYIPEFSNAFGAFFDFLLLYFSELVFNLFLFALLSLLDVVNERSFETEFEYLGLSSDNMVEFVEVLLDLLSFVLIAFVNDIVEVCIFVD